MRVSKVIRIQLLLITLALDPNSLAGNCIERNEDKHIGTPKDRQNKILKQTPSEILYIKVLEILRRISGFIRKYFLVSGHLDESICAELITYSYFRKFHFLQYYQRNPSGAQAGSQKNPKTGTRDPTGILRKPIKRDLGP